MSYKDKQRRWDKALIIGLGDDVPVDHPPISGNTLIVCADGGSTWAKQWGLTPHLILGDFDSQSTNDYQYWDSKGVSFQSYPPEKDQTDLELAIDYCLSLGIRDIIMVGVWGGRIDHSLGNLELLYRLGTQNIQASIETKQASLKLVCSCLALTVTVGSLISLIPLTSKVSKVTTTGLYYPLDRATLVKGNTLGISNKAVEEEVSISSGEGILLVIATKP